MSQLKDNFSNNKTFKNDLIELIPQPFQLGIVKDLLQETSILNAIREEFNGVNWYKRNMDLYELFQSDDLSKMSFKQISIIYEFLKREVMPWVGEVTGLELKNISATCSFYSHTDYLLVHDDQQDDRLVAFVLYLTGKENWKEEWGGAFEMFSSDEDGHPNKAVRSIYPSNNQFVFFPVTNRTYHQVSSNFMIYVFFF